MTPKIHPSAVVHPSAKLAEGVEVGPHAFIGEGVEVGEGTLIGPGCLIEHAKLGKGNKIVGHAFLGTPPQDFSYAGESTRLELGDRNIVREGVTMNRGTKATGVTRVGSDGMFMAYAHIAHDCVVGDKVIMANSATLAGHCKVGDRAFLSGLSAFHQFVRVGTGAIVSGGAMANQDIAPYCTAQGDRAVIRGLNLVGMRRSGFSRDAIAAVKAAYKTVFLSGLRLEEAIARLKGGACLPEVQVFVDFISASKRGLARPSAGVEQEQEAVA